MSTDSEGAAISREGAVEIEAAAITGDADPGVKRVVHVSPYRLAGLVFVAACAAISLMLLVIDTHRRNANPELDAALGWLGQAGAIGVAVFYTVASLLTVEFSKESAWPDASRVVATSFAATLTVFALRHIASVGYLDGGRAALAMGFLVAAAAAIIGTWPWISEGTYDGTRGMLAMSGQAAVLLALLYVTLRRRGIAMVVASCALLLLGTTAWCSAGAVQDDVEAI